MDAQAIAQVKAGMAANNVPAETIAAVVAKLSGEDTSGVVVVVAADKGRTSKPKAAPKKSSARKPKADKAPRTFTAPSAEKLAEWDSQPITPGQFYACRALLGKNPTKAALAKVASMSKADAHRTIAASKA